MKGQFVSIILPTYNGNKKWISESIQSVLDQTYTNFELIIINDASTNDIETTILAFAKKDERIKHYKNDENLQLTKTLNRGIKFSQGEYIARIDDDDLWCDRNKLEKQVDYMNKNPDCGIVGTHAYFIDHQGDSIGTIHHSTKDGAIRKRLFFTNQFIHSSILIRKCALNDVGTYDPQRNYIEDYELRLRIGREYDFANIDAYCVCYRKSIASITSQKNMIQHNMILKLIHNYKYSYPNGLLASIVRVGIICLMHFFGLFGKYRFK